MTLTHEIASLTNLLALIVRSGVEHNGNASLETPFESLEMMSVMG
jgi:hypothetical protein